MSNIEQQQQHQETKSPPPSIVAVAVAAVVVVAAAAVFVADPLTANNDAGFVSVPLGPPINPITSNV